MKIAVITGWDGIPTSEQISRAKSCASFFKNIKGSKIEVIHWFPPDMLGGWREICRGWREGSDGVVLNELQGKTIEGKSVWGGASPLLKYDLLCFISYSTFALINKKDRKKLPPYLILDIGFFKNMNHTMFHLAWGSINGLGRYYQKHYNGSRLHYAKKDELEIDFVKNRSNQYVLILAQNAKDSFVTDRGTSYKKWLVKTCKEILDITTKPIMIRTSPHDGESMPEYLPQITTERVKLLPKKGSIHEEISKACATVAFSSSSGMYSLAQGIPHISCDPGSIVYDITPHAFDQIDNLPTPDFQEVTTKLEQLTWRCWTLKEIKEGGPIELLINGLGPELC